jgi:hypothetical protein
MIETFDDVLEDLMDRIGVYGSHDPYNDKDHEKCCRCRVCYREGLKQRILNGIHMEELLNEHPKANKRIGKDKEPSVGLPLRWFRMVRMLYAKFRHKPDVSRDREADKET